MPANFHRLGCYAKDDTTRRTAPLQHVDYFSSEWKEEDIWLSWKLVVSQRGLCDKSARLENAAWRLWAKTRQQLRTSSPESINWYFFFFFYPQEEAWTVQPSLLTPGRLKISDITHLYGPLEQRLLPARLDSIPTRSILKRSKSNIVLLDNVYTPCLSKIASRSAALADETSYLFPFTGDLLERISTLSPRRHIKFNEQVEQRIITTNRKQKLNSVGYIIR